MGNVLPIGSKTLKGSKSAAEVKGLNTAMLEQEELKELRAKTAELTKMVTELTTERDGYKVAAQDLRIQLDNTNTTLIALNEKCKHYENIRANVVTYVGLLETAKATIKTNMSNIEKEFQTLIGKQSFVEETAAFFQVLKGDLDCLK